MPKEHPESNHPAVGRFRHSFTRTAATANGMRRLAATVDKCARCGMDEAFHSLTKDDYTGDARALATFLETANDEIEKGDLAAVKKAAKTEADELARTRRKPR